MARSRIALLLAAAALLAGTVVGCGSGPEVKDDSEDGEPKMERTSPGDEERTQGREEDEEDDDDDDEDS